MPDIFPLKESNDHLINVGLKLAQAETDRKTAFISHALEDGRTYIKGDWLPLLDPSQDCLRTTTLQSVVDYLDANPDSLELDKVLVHVVSPLEVTIRSVPFGAFRQRCEYMTARPIIPTHLFNKDATPDVFVPYLQSCFCESEDLSALLKIAGNIVDTTEVHLKDDGVSQEATVRSGASRKSLEEVPSPAVLFPFSTFTEVPQPPRKFVFRLKSEPLRCTLLEADGGAWQLAAMEGIAGWLRERLPDEVKLIA